MAPKRKAPAAPAAAAPAKAAKGDGKAKGGRPTAAAQLAKQAPAAGTPAADRSIAFMFGARTPAAAKAPTAFTADLKKWQYSGIGGEEAITQKQVIGGPVLCMLETPPGSAASGEHFGVQVHLGTHEHVAAGGGIRM